MPALFSEVVDYRNRDRLRGGHGVLLRRLGATGQGSTVHSQRFVRTSEWMRMFTIEACCTKIMRLATGEAFLHTSKSMFDVLRRPVMLLKVREVTTKGRKTLSRPSQRRPVASCGSTS